MYDKDIKNFFGIEQKSIDENLDYLIHRLEKDTKNISPGYEFDAAKRSLE